MHDLVSGRCLTHGGATLVEPAISSRASTSTHGARCEQRPRHGPPSRPTGARRSAYKDLDTGLLLDPRGRDALRPPPTSAVRSLFTSAFCVRRPRACTTSSPGALSTHGGATLGVQRPRPGTSPRPTGARCEQRPRHGPPSRPTGARRSSNNDLITGRPLDPRGRDARRTPPTSVVRSRFTSAFCVRRPRACNDLVTGRCLTHGGATFVEQRRRLEAPPRPRGAWRLRIPALDADPGLELEPQPAR